jgi:hypothetical protein
MNLWTVLLGISGLLLVAMMMLFGADLVRASRTGPRWKRALVTAAVSLISLLGFSASGATAAKPSVKAVSAPSDASAPVVAIFDLKSQLADLSKLTSRREFNSQTATETLRKAKANVAILSKPENAAKLNQTGRAEAERLLVESAKIIAIAETLIPIGTSDLLKTPQWKLIVDTWRASGALTGSRGSTSAQRVAMKEKFLHAKQAAAELADAGLISTAEAQLLAVDADVIWARIIARPPSDSRKTCYKMAYFPPAKRSVQWLTKRLKLVREVAAADKITPAALDKVMGNITGHLAILGSDAELKKLRKPADRQAAIKLRDEIAPLVAMVKRRVLATRLARTSGWRTVDSAFLAAGPPAKSHRSTSAQRTAIAKKIKAANAAMASMAAAELLTAGEAELMTGELARLRTEIYRDPPTDFKGTCYGASAPINPVIVVTKRLGRRVVLLGKLVESGRLNPQVVKKLLPSVRADIKLLVNAKQAAELRAKADALVKQIESKLPTAGSTADVAAGT